VGAPLDVILHSASIVTIDANANIRANQITAVAQAIDVRGGVFSYGADINNSSPLIALLAGRISISGVLRANSQNATSGASGTAGKAGAIKIEVMMKLLSPMQQLPLMVLMAVKFKLFLRTVQLVSRKATSKQMEVRGVAVQFQLPVSSKRPSLQQRWKLPGIHKGALY